MDSKLDWQIFDVPVPYPEAVMRMEAHVDAMASEKARAAVWVMEHPACYTAGTSARAEDLKDPRFPVYQTGRGGQYTYHGPGQLVVYPLVDLRARYPNGPDVKQYVYYLEEWIIRVLAALGVVGERRAGRVGIWVVGPDEQEDKIAAIGIRVRRGVAFHGFSINYAVDLTHFSGIVPCGISAHGITSLDKLDVLANRMMLQDLIRSQGVDLGF